MGLSADRTVKGMKGGGVVMRSLETQCVVRACPGVRNGRGQDQVAAVGDLPRQDQVFQGKEEPHPVTAVRLFGGSLRWEKWGCGQCPHSRSRTGQYRCRSGPDSLCFGEKSSVCKGWNPVRVPPRAQCFLCSETCWPLKVHRLFTCGPLSGPFSSGGRCGGRRPPFFPRSTARRSLPVHGHPRPGRRDPS
jgi:hypothetical protein